MDYIIILGYLALTLMFGIYRGKYVRNMRDFAVSRGSFTTAALVATVFGTIIGGGSTIEPLGKMFSFGLVFFLPFLGESLSKLITSEFILPRFSRFENMLSIGDIFEHHYGRLGKILCGLSGFLLLSGYVGAQITAGSIFMGYFTGMPAVFSILITTAVVIAYSAFGGIRSVIYTDMIQFIVILVALPVVAHISLYQVGGWSALIDAVPREKLAILPSDSAMWIEFLAVFIYCMPYFSPAVVQRFLIAKNTKQIQTSFRIAAFLDIPFYLLLALIALCLIALEPNIEPSIALPFLIEHYLPTIYKGFAISGFLAIIMSSADSFLNAASISLVHDFLKPLWPSNLKDKDELFLVRLSTIVIGIVAAFHALYFNDILKIHFSAARIWVPVILFPFLAIVFGRAKSRTVFFVAGACGLISTFIWDAWFGAIGNTLPGFLVNALVYSLMPDREEKTVFKRA